MFNEFLKQIKRYFGFSTGESRGLVLLIFLMLLYLLSPKILNLFTKEQSESSIHSDRYLDSLQAVLNAQTVELDTFYNKKFERNYDYEPHDNFSENQRIFKPKMLFEFDPNTVSAEELAKTGLPKSICDRLVKYRAAGGKFYKNEDFRKLYGITDEMYASLAPYVKLANSSIKTVPEKTLEKGDKVGFTKIALQPFDINTADTATLSKVKGIGTTLSQRIIKRRESLGGFHDAFQIRELYGLSPEVADELLKYTKFSAQNLRKIQINRVEKLYHPYLPYHVSKAILAYRQQHGPFKEAADLRKVKLLDEKTLELITPYVTFE